MTFAQRRTLRGTPARRAGALLALAALGLAAPSALGSAPAPPPGSDAATRSLDAVAGKDIPDAADAATPGAPVTSSITVSGAQPVLRDVDVVTTIPHAASGDLRITITSPQHTTVVLNDVVLDYYTPQYATRGNADLFNGVTWDDDAVAADGTSRPVSDLPLFPAGLSGTLGSLVPEGALGAFIGEDPNGTWTLTVQDRSPGGTGRLDGWGLRLATMALAPPETTATIGDPSTTVLADGTGHPGVSTTDIPLPVTGQGGYLTGVTVTARITHPHSSDMSFWLVSPAGTAVPLVTRGMYWGDQVMLPTDGGEPWRSGIWDGTVWDDHAGAMVAAIDWNAYNAPTLPAFDRLVPEGALAALNGENPNGTWRLRLSDYSNGHVGVVSGWELRLRSTDGFPVPPPSPAGGGGAATGDVVCRTAPAVPAVRARALHGDRASAARADRMIGTALARADAIERWLDAGITARDLCGNAVGSTRLSSPTGATNTTRTAAVPSPRTVAEAAARPSGIRLSARVTAPQARLLDLRARLALRRATALRTRLTGHLTGGDLVDGAVTADKLAPGLTVTARTGASAAASVTAVAAVRVAMPPAGAPAVRYLRDAEAKGRQATVILNALRATLATGLTGANFRDGSIGGAKLG